MPQQICKNCGVVDKQVAYDDLTGLMLCPSCLDSDTEYVCSECGLPAYRDEMSNVYTVCKAAGVEFDKPLVLCACCSVRAAANYVEVKV